MVGFRIVKEAHCLNCIVSQQQRPADTVHSIHHPAIGRQNHRVRQIAVGNQARMIDNVAARQSTIAVPCPIRLIQFTNVGQGHAFDQERTGQLNKPADIPCAESLR